MTASTLNRILKGLCVVLFLAWLPCLIYPASKLLSFTVIPLRTQLLAVSILILNLWAVCFAVLMRDTPKANLLSKTSKKATATQLVPLGFSVFLGAVYVLYSS